MQQWWCLDLWVESFNAKGLPVVSGILPEEHVEEGNAKSLSSSEGEPRPTCRSSIVLQNFSLLNGGCNRTSGLSSGAGWIR